MSNRRIPTRKSSHHRRSSTQVLLFLTLLVTPFLASPAARAACTTTKRTSEASTSTMALHAFNDVPTSDLEGAVAIWNHCRNYGSELPQLRVEGTADQTLVVRYRQVSDAVGRCGMISGDIITVYANARDELGRTLHCGPRAVNLAHEIGHYLGLRDASADRECRHHIMTGVARRDAGLRTVDPEICAAVSELWQVAFGSGASGSLDQSLPSSD